MNKLWKFHWNIGRMGKVDGLFIATDEEVNNLIGKYVYFGEILGKHSEVYGKVEPNDITLITDNQIVVGELKYREMTIGYNPFDYVQDDVR